jgi:hypothetical protein
MFTGSLLTRRLRLRRLRRSAARFGRKLDAVVGLPDLDEMLGQLCVWATGMPWVAESPCTAREMLKLFVLDCTPLSCHEPWFAINSIDDDTDDGPGIIVIFSDAVADRATATGCTGELERIGRRRSITAIGLPTSEEEFQALQRLLEVTYAAAFESSK